MSYLRLIQDKVQHLAEDICTALKVDITIVDEDHVRIGGTGDYYNMINEKMPEDSLFAGIISSGETALSVIEVKNNSCKYCSIFSTCREMGHIAYPIKNDGKIIGVIGFIAFNEEQRDLLTNQYDEYFNILHNIAEMIENEVEKIKVSNSLNIKMAEVNGIINSINKGIIIVNSDGKITHVNAKTLNILNINLSIEKVIGRKITGIINNMKMMDTHNQKIIGNWKVNDNTIKVIYEISDVVLDNKKISALISFDGIKEIINIAMDKANDNNISFEHIIGKSKALMKVIEKAKIAAKSDSTVFLQGESGTGKELFARALHNNGTRKNENFVVINCASIPENLLESELFGYEKGAFTGANTQGKTGKFELANNGTLFLDEIGDLPLHLQPKLLRVLQEKEVVKVGGNKSIKINVRIISATHKNLEKMVKDGMFRHDLFYRLNVIPIMLPALKERGTDVLLISEYILKKLCQRMSVADKKLGAEVEKKILSYDWPGNIRELENVLEYAVNFSHNDEITLSDLPDFIFNEQETKIHQYEVDEGRDLGEIRDEFEYEMIMKYMGIYGESTEGKKKIAKKLGISLTTLYRRLQNMK